MKYYLHSVDTMDDEKVSKLFIKFGYEGTGLFHAILEKLAKQEKPIDTDTLKFQLKVGKKLEKVWLYMEEIQLISSQNGETFNNNLLNFSENYRIKKEKTRKKVSEWRENQKDMENVTGYNGTCNPPKVNKSKVNKSKYNIISWKNDFEIYKQELMTEYNRLVNDLNYIAERQKYHNGLNIILSMEKALNDYWMTEEGWKNKKDSRTNKINWKTTFNAALSQRINQVWQKKIEPEVRKGG